MIAKVMINDTGNFLQPQTLFMFCWVGQCNVVFEESLEEILICHTADPFGD